MVSADSSFIAILVAVLCCQGYERDLEKRAKRKKARKEAEEEAKAAKRAKKLRKEHEERQEAHRREENIALAVYRRRPVTPADFESLSFEALETRRRYGDARRDFDINQHPY